MNVKKLTTLALLTALALILSYAESLAPSPFPVPGVKMGLPNLAVVFALYRLGPREAFGISLVRVVMVSMLFGTGASFLYSLSGALLSFLGMTALRRTGLFSCTGVSVAGGVLHNMGQILMACFLLKTNIFFYYFPFLMVSGVLAGVVIGLLSGIVLQRVENGMGNQGGAEDRH